MSRTRMISSILTLASALWLISTIPAAAQTDGAATGAESGCAFAPDVRSQEENRATPPAPRAPKPTRSKGIRTLDEITIEGEIAVPQVLFIMARERHRYHDRLHLLYLKSSLEIGNETVFPTELVTRLRP